MSSSTKVLDCSFMGIVELEDLLQVSPQALYAAASNTEVKNEEKSDAKLTMNSLKLCSNQLTSIETLPNVLNEILEEPNSLRWLDLSCNQIETLGEALAPFENLGVLYLHGNAVEKFSELRRFSESGNFPNLRSLTLHGNPVADNKHYRNYLIHTVPSLNQLDFSPITKLDRDRAATWARTYRKKLAKARGIDIEDM
mmetsp:Transcript_35727/g.47138  ORF Transcript_35727/g.47138 Transcript_35727/m.47138 type:complete len:197 (+) Transcript_35727:44-634(+)